MNEMDEEGIYQVPGASLLLRSADLQAQAPDEARPPTLMPKKGNSFRASFAALDRRAPSNPPKPAPRRLSTRNASVDSLPEEKDASSISSRSASFDVEAPHKADSLETFQIEPFSPVLVKPRASPASVSSDGAMTSSSDSLDNLSKGEKKPAKPRPVPKPRARTQISPVERKPTADENQLSEQIGAFNINPMKNVQQPSDGMSETEVITHSDAQQSRDSSTFFPLPPDADSLELLINKEIEDKYGFEDTSLKANSSSAVSSTSSKAAFPIKQTDLSDPCGVVNLVTTDTSEEANNEDLLTIAKDRNSSQTLPALNQASIDLEASLMPENTLVKEQPSFPSLPSSSNESSSSSPSASTESQHVSQKLPFELADFESPVPSWQDNCDELPPKNSFFDDTSEFEYSSAQSTVTSDLNSIYSVSIAFNTSEQRETNQSSEPHLVNKPQSGFSGWEEPLAPPPPLPKETNLFRPQVPPPVPPRPGQSPILFPNRPENLLLPHSDGRQEPLEEAASSIFDELPTPQFSSVPDGGDPFEGSGFDNDCFNFNTKTEQDGTVPPFTSSPPRASTTLPTPPSPSTKPKIWASNDVMAGATGSAGVPPSPSQDPERISRFVPPPPGAHMKISEDNLRYDLARGLKKVKGNEGESDSDDEDGGSPSYRRSEAMDMAEAMDPRRFLPRTEPQSPKKNIREGFLNKQGGFNANKGWRKRWVVFDGSKLSYYSSKKSQVSNRIVPVSCIKNVEIDVKGDSYKFKVSTTLKDRVFVFSAENRDDCTMWANVLMAAVVAYKNNGQANPEDDPALKPDKEGFIHFGNMKEYYVTITGQMFRYFQSFDDFRVGSPVHEIDMKLASVKDNDSKKKLQLWVHYGSFDLSFPSEQEKQQWHLAMEDAIAEGLSDDTFLQKVYENLSNHNCADCGADNPHWASVNLGIVVCKNCAGIHRMFDFRVSRIKSLRMDTRVWTPSLIELLITIGNANANMFWAYRLTAGDAIHSHENIEKRKDFITRKYMDKKWADKHPLVNLRPALGDELLNAARADNVLGTMKILFSGADVMYRDAENQTAYEIVKEGGQKLVMEFLFQNGGDPQTLVKNVQDDNRLREDVRLQGFLNKTGPLGKTFERRWCVIEHGALTYYANEKNNMSRGSIDRREMVMISSVDNDRIGYQFELSTTVRDNRTYIFSSDIKDDTGEWMRTIAKLMAPVAVMEHVGMIDIYFAGYAYMKELVNEWHETFLVFSWRILKYMNRDLKFESIDLRKASSIRMQDANSGYQNSGPCFVISSTGWSVYLQASLPRDTEKMYNCLLGAITASGSTLSNQSLTTNDVPVIVDRCITHIEVHGLKEMGVYRTAGQSSRVQALLDAFRRDALSVSLSEYPVAEVADTLKRFLRDLDDSVFERMYYPAWVSAAGITEVEDRLNSYDYYLKKMPIVNCSTLKRLMLHLHQVSEYSADNKMSIKNLASCFAPSLMRTNKDTEIPSGDVTSKEIKVIIDLLENKDFFFHADEEERIRAHNIERAQSEIRRAEALRKSVHHSSLALQSWLVPFQILDRDDAVNIEVTETRTAAEAMEKLVECRFVPSHGNYALYETLFNGSLVRPIFPKDTISETTNRWAEFDAFKAEDIGMSLSLQGMELLETLDMNNLQNHSLQAELQYSDAKSKKFKSKTVRFKQYQLAIYNKSKDTEAAACWNVEDLSFYIGAWPKRHSPSRYCLTFLISNEKYTKAFGHCLGFSSEEDLYKWAAVLYAVQNPEGLLGWASVSSSS